VSSAKNDVYVIVVDYKAMLSYNNKACKWAL